jgi:hypothetical protein
MTPERFPDDRIEISQAISLKPLQLLYNSLLDRATTIAEYFARNQGIDLGQNTFLNGYFYSCLTHYRDSLGYDEMGWRSNKALGG